MNPEVEPRLVDEGEVRRIIVALLVRSGTDRPKAQVVANHLIGNSLRGVHSHGVLRVPEYLQAIASGKLQPNAVPVNVQERGSRLWVDGGGGFGQIGAEFASKQAVKLARVFGLSIVVLRNAGHTGRLGAYAELVATRGFMGLVFSSSPLGSIGVAPFGGRDARFTTNPMAFAVPTAEEPIIGDFSTSATAEGVVRSLLQRGMGARPGMLQDASGIPTTDPRVLYREPVGTLQPLGGKEFGHKGTALAILVEAMSTLLAGDDVSDTSRGFALTVVAVKVDRRYDARAQRLGDWVKSSRPAQAGGEVLLPGEPERLTFAAARKLVSMSEETWSGIARWAQQLKVSIDGAR